MKLREFAKVAENFFDSNSYVVYTCDEYRRVKDIFYPDIETASVENLLDCEVISIGSSAISKRTSIDVVENNDAQALEQIMREITEECNEFLDYLKSFKR